MTTYLLAIDQGTSSSRAIVFNELSQPLSQHQIDFTCFYPESGWVEQNPEDLWQTTIKSCHAVMKSLSLSAKDIAAIGISNQRETTLIWDRKTGIPIYPAIVWQDRRTSHICRELSTQAIAAVIPNKTGLLLDPYFSATKIMWLLENIPGARMKAERGELAFGTVDTFLLWRLTQGKSHATDATNASRTLLFNIHTQKWDQEILSALRIPEALMPEVLDSAAKFGETYPELFGSSIPIAAMLGDQQAATVGQACFHAGMVKATYGTGAFIMLNTGSNRIHSKNRLLSTIAYRLQGKPTYGLEGSIFSAGVTVKWLRDSMKFIQSAAESETLANSVEDTAGVYLVPAFTGLGAPYWDPEARGAILGLTRNSSIAHIVRAGLEAVCYQTRDLLECMQRDGVKQWSTLRVDGGMAANAWFLQFLADVLEVSVQRPACIETSALGAIYLAGLQVGIYQSLEEIESLWQAQQILKPHHAQNHFYLAWKEAVKRIVTPSDNLC